jgi:hypothetical protein
MLELAAGPGRVQPSGLRHFGVARDFRVVERAGRDGPVREPGVAEPATIFRAHDGTGRTWLTAVIVDEAGRPAMAADGVGKLAVVEAEVER